MIPFYLMYFEVKQICSLRFGIFDILRGLSGWWSWSISQEDIMVCRVTGIGDKRALEIAQLRFQYQLVNDLAVVL